LIGRPVEKARQPTLCWCYYNSTSYRSKLRQYYAIVMPM